MNDYWEERHEEQEERRLFAALKKIFDVLVEIRDVLLPRPTSLKLQITGGSPMPLPVGASSTATLSVLDQNGNVIQNFDFSANPPQWSVDNVTVVSIAPGPNPNDEVFTGLAEGAVNGNVACAGLTLPFNFNVVAVGGAVPTSLRLDFNPPVA
jgi:hypothetical protein